AEAKRLGCSLEELVLRLRVGGAAGAFAVCGLRVEGAVWDGHMLVLNDGRHEPLPDCALEWVRCIDEEDEGGVAVPVYLNTDRSALLFEARLPVDGPVDCFVQRGVAIVAA
ncbi:dynein heavy chain, partial [Coemansia furcata]